jgi:3-dehydroquinate synthase
VTPVVYRVRVELGRRSYPVLVSPAGIALAARVLCRVEAPLFVVTDSHVARFVWPRLAAAFRRHGRPVPRPHLLPAGERAKRWGQVARLHRAMLAHGCDRNTCVVAIGGGVVLDVSGFAAATYMRGVDWVAVPTSLLAMVDAAVGGKVAIDLGGTKNVVGAFHQPRAVLAGTDFLRTLPLRERRNGLAEVVKSAMIADRRLFTRLESSPRAWLRPRPAADARLVTRCVTLKARVVGEDEQDRNGVRARLNFGHTIGHALEGDGRRGLLHGEAVALGMLAACAVGAGCGIAREPQIVRLRQLLVRLGLPVSLRAPLRVDALRRAWQRDKKVHGGAPRFVLTPRIGTASVGHRVSEGQIIQALRVIAAPRLEPHSRTPPRPPGAIRRGAK